MRRSKPRKGEKGRNTLGKKRSPHDGSNAFMGLVRAQGGCGQWLEAVEVKGGGCFVRSHQRECVVEVHEESVAPPVEMALNGRNQRILHDRLSLQL